jgi:hypothetical protein
MKRQRVMVAVWKEKLTFNQSVYAAEAIVKLTEGEAWPFDTAIAPNPFSYVGVNKLLGTRNVVFISMKRMI